MKLSNVAIIHFVNELFDTNHTLNSAVEYLNTENVSRKLKKLLSDTIIIINGLYVHSLELQIRDDENLQ